MICVRNMTLPGCSSRFGWRSGGLQGDIDIDDEVDEISERPSERDEREQFVRERRNRRVSMTLPGWVV